MTKVWQPSPERAANANIEAFMRRLRSTRDLHFPDYASLHEWSVTAPADFWRELADFAHVRAVWGNGPDLIHPDRMPGAIFFPGAQLNFAENVLRFRDDRAALIFSNEAGARREISFAELHVEVARIAAGLIAAGVRPGDRVAAFIPNIPEAIIAALATASIGAVWSSCSPEFGLPAVLDRFGQIAPKILLTADGYVYAGKTFNSLPLMSQLAAQLPGIERVVVVPYLQRDPALDGFGSARATLWPDFGASTAELCAQQTSFNHPLYILYSSGTTGAPKCIVHGAGGTLLQHLKEHLLHVDLRPADRLFYVTTCGWMMWNWQLTALATGASLVLYDGSPLQPEAQSLWRIVADEKVTVFGTSAKYLSALRKSGARPREFVDLCALRTLLTTGSPLAPEGFDYAYRDIKADLHLASISGGTDIVSCFALGCPILPVHRGELQCRGLGMRVEIFDEHGRSIVGERGELVCTAPFPSMPIGFWNDPDGSRFRATYFERFPGVWHHGDYATRTEHDGIVIHGRSDAVLKPGGVRIGTAEIYAAVESLDEVLECIAVGQDWEGDVRIVLFVRLRAGCELEEILRRKICETIRARATPRHVPARIVAVPDIPRTRSGKLTEIAVREIVHGRDVGNREALANPEALAHFRGRIELQS